MGKKADSWEVIRKDYLPNHVMIFPSSGTSSYTYALGQIRVIEKHKETQEIRERIINTDPLYLRDNPDLTTEFQIAQIGLNAIEKRIKANDL